MASWMERLLAGETLVSETPGRAILRCKPCGKAGVVEYALVARTNLGGNGRPKTVTSLRTPGSTREGRLDTTRTNPLAWALHRACPVCGSGAGVTVKVVDGTLVPSTACNDRCMSATGASCSCSCGGEQHGATHGAFA